MIGGWLSEDTVVATPTGWTDLAYLSTGSVVFDKDGNPTTVVCKMPPEIAQVSRVGFSDGASLVVSDSCNWHLERRTPSATYTRDKLLTVEILAAGVADRYGARRFRIENARPIKMPDATLPVPPYTLGAWLGDGDTGGTRIVGLDLEVFENIGLDGFDVAQGLPAKRWNVRGLAKKLRDAGVYNHKRIPPVYLRASETQRWSLLQGLMDTDGSADAAQGKCEFATVLPDLRDGVRELLYTLGIRHMCYEGVASIGSTIYGPKWRLSFQARSDMPIFRIVRKQERLRPPGGAHSQFGHRRIVSIDTGKFAKGRGIIVDSPAHTFLAGSGMIPVGDSS
jgi:hypothetical protein